MKWLDLTLPTPAQNLACDEALLDLCEEHGGDPLLRFWEPSGLFVVLGYANRVATEVNASACAARSVPILRRCTGGGTVLQGPGCLNYSLILRVEQDGPLQGIASANRFIMERHRTALATLLDQEVEVRGHTDLVIDGRKFSGNAQRRKQRRLLFHGSFLLDLDLDAVSDFLPLPSRQPDYRKHRSHRDFLRNLGVPPESVKRALREAWSAKESFGAVPLDRVESLACDKYETTAWNFRF